jgi:hypothetical protein
MNAFTIEKNIPVPPPKSVGSHAELLKKMAPGDSVFLTNRNSVTNLCVSGKRLGFEMVSRKLEGGHRVWLLGTLKEKEGL